MRKMFAAIFLLFGFASAALGITNPGVYALAVDQITVAQTAQAFTAITDLDGATAVTIECQFQYGSGGSTASATVQTSFDGGSTWRDIARCDFTTSTAVKHFNLSGLLSKAATPYAALNSEGVNDGVLGNQLRAIVTSTGTYSNTILSVRVSVR